MPECINNDVPFLCVFSGSDLFHAVCFYAALIDRRRAESQPWAEPPEIGVSLALECRWLQYIVKPKGLYAPIISSDAVRGTTEQHHKGLYEVILWAAIYIPPDSNSD